MDIKSRLLIFVMQIQPRSLKLLCFLYFMNEKFNKNAKVEKLTKKVGRGVRLIVIGPLHQLIHHFAKITYIIWLIVSFVLFYASRVILKNKSLLPPPRGFKSTRYPPYPQRVVKDDYMGRCLGITVSKGWPRVWCLDWHV